MPDPTSLPIPHVAAPRNPTAGFRQALSRLAVATTLLLAGGLFGPRQAFSIWALEPAIQEVKGELSLDDTLFLTWDADPTTTMTVQWLTAESEPSAIEWSTAGEEEWRRIATQVSPFGPSSWFVSRARLQGLRPGHDYLVRRAGEDRRYRFRTAPETADGISFVAGGDAGPYEATARVCRAAAKHRPLFALLGGDLAYANGREPERWIRFLNIWHREMVTPNGRMIPIVVSIGNHEVDKRQDKSRSAAPYFFSLFHLFREQSYSALDFGSELSLILLDSGHVSPVIGEQREWLERTLRERLTRPHVFAIYHVPAYPSHRNSDGPTATLIQENWVPLFDRYGVDVAYENNDHTYKRTLRLTAGSPASAGVLYLGDGCWGVRPRSAVRDDTDPKLARTFGDNHFILTELNPSEQRHQVYDDKGRWQDTYPLPEFQLHVDHLDALSKDPIVLSDDVAALWLTLRSRAGSAREIETRLRLRSDDRARDWFPSSRPLMGTAGSSTPQTMTTYSIDDLEPGEYSVSALGTQVDAFGHSRFESGTLARFHVVASKARAPAITETSPAPTEPGGLSYRSVAGRFREYPNFEESSIVERGVCAPRDWRQVLPEGRDFALEFRGYFHAPTTGIYRFVVDSDDAATLQIGERRVIEGSGRYHRPRTRQGFIHLKAGWHRADLMYFSRRSQAALSIRITPPGEKERPSRPEDWAPMVR